MKKYQIWLTLLLCCTLLGSKGGCQKSSDEANIQSPPP